MPVKTTHWGRGLFLVIYQLLVVGGLPLYLYHSTPSAAMVAWTLVLYFLTGISITGGYHRYYAHRSFKASAVPEFFLLLFGTLALQGSALRWSFDHRLHHAYVDKDRDPYSISKGFWYAHFLWIFDGQEPIQEKYAGDLLRNRMVMFQHRHYLTLALLSNALVLGLGGWLLGDFAGAALFLVGLRLMALHHTTWFINSLAHTFGSKPYCRELSAVNNFILALLTFGEGYHNFHHVFAADYRNGIRWFHFDPTKWLIWTLHKLGLAWSLNRSSDARIHQRLLREDLKQVIAKVTEIQCEQRDNIKSSVENLFNSLHKKLEELHRLRQQYEGTVKARADKKQKYCLKKSIKELKKDISVEWQRWNSLCHSALSGHLQGLKP